MFRKNKKDKMDKKEKIEKKDTNVIGKVSNKIGKTLRTASRKKSKDNNNNEKNIDNDSTQQIEPTQSLDANEVTTTSDSGDWTIDDSDYVTTTISPELSEKLKNTLIQFNITSPQPLPVQSVKSTKSLPLIPTQSIMSTTSLPPQDTPPPFPTPIELKIVQEPLQQVALESELEYQTTNSKTFTTLDTPVTHSSFLDELNEKRMKLRNTANKPKDETLISPHKEMNNPIKSLVLTKTPTPTTLPEKPAMNFNDELSEKLKSRKVKAESKKEDDAFISKDANKPVVTEEFTTLILQEEHIVLRLDNDIPSPIIVETKMTMPDITSEKTKVAKNKSSFFCCCGADDSSEEEKSKLVPKNTTVQMI